MRTRLKAFANLSTPDARRLVRRKNKLSSMSSMLNSRRNLKTKLRMSQASSSAGPVVDVVKNSSLYREFQAEREEILRHKWIESEKAGFDIGFERALTDWIVKHRAKWREARQALAAVPLVHC
ncbi:MAG: DUF4032 domain-containing protein [Verrucomicrobia bacterium]|nr:DUF4032 domain-containing protein [Verrucomicrobiota bacterium]